MGSIPELLVIVGPTASGKSELAMRVAKKFNGEIVAADSWTVYKGFNIGTAKPSPAEQKVIKHHLLDVAEAKKGFNASEFKRLAETAISDIQQRGKLPILAGGTGLYIDSVVFGFGFLPSSSPEERRTLNQMTIQGLIELAAQKKIDLTGVDIRNKRRIIRAIEAKGQKPSKKGLKQGTLIIGIQPPPGLLKKKIGQRVDNMLKQGLETETEELYKKYGWDNEPMKGIGYKEWQEYFEGKQTLEETRQRIVASTMSLVKRQKTWFKRNPYIRWFDSPDAAFEYISEAFKAG